MLEGVLLSAFGNTKRVANFMRNYTMATKYRSFQGHGPKKTGAVLIRDAQTGKRLFIMCFYDLPFPLASIAVAMTEKQAMRYKSDELITGGQLIRHALKRHGLDPDRFMVSIFETANTSLV